MLLMATMLLAACSTDDDNSAVVGSTDTLQLVAYCQQTADAAPLMTRGLTTGNLGNYAMYEGPNAIGVFLTSGTTAPNRVSTFTWNETNGSWESRVNVKPQPYMIYGFMPTAFASEPSFSYTIRPVSSDYANGATLMFTSLPSVASEDFCLLTGVQDLGGSSTAALDLKRGQFSYQGREKGKNFVNLMFEHLYAGILFQMKVGTTYSTLRTIKLKELKLKTSTSISTVTWTVQVTPNNTEAVPYVITPTATFLASDSEATLFKSDDGQELATTAYDISGYVYPFQSDNDYIGNHLSIVCTYDVYDRKGNLIRQNCTAENKLPVTPDEQWKSGNRIVVPLTVEPTYLYVLSEPDLDNPTIIIN